MRDEVRRSSWLTPDACYLMPRLKAKIQAPPFIGGESREPKEEEASLRRDKQTDNLIKFRVLHTFSDFRYTVAVHKARIDDEPEIF